MRALVLHHRHGDDGLRLEEVAEPRRPSGWVTVRVWTAALNRVDVYMRRNGAGITHRLPMILGLDAVGEVVECEAGSALAPGTPVVLYPALFCGRCRFCLAGEQPLCLRVRYYGEHRDGVFAEYVSAPEVNLLPLPDDADPVEAACLPTAYLTAWRMLFGKRPLGPEETVLVMGAGGGVSLAAVQLARMAGARPIAVSRRPEALTRAREVGAEVTLRLGRDDVVAAVLELTDGLGADMVVENVGRVTWPLALRAVRRGGRIVTCGATTGGDPPAELQRVFIRQIEIYGSTLGSLEEFRRLLAAWRRGLFRPVIHRVYPFAEAIRALDELEAGRQIGKLVLDLRRRGDLTPDRSLR